jgi:N-acetyl-gamma-glutamyl-phosphate reductase
MGNIRAGIIGGAGYTGGELLRLLLHHSAVEVAFVQSSSNAGKPVYAVHADLAGDTDLHFAASHHFEVDVLFFCAGHGEAKKFVADHSIPAQIKLIDIGNDFRLAADSRIAGRSFVYGLPELNLAALTGADSVANPGCFATAIQLGLLPLAAAGLLQQVHTTGITGSTGAGQGLSATSHFSWRANNIQAYKTLTHQHLSEIHQSLAQAATGQALAAPRVHFIPWRGDFTRGIFISSTVHTQLSLEDLVELYKSYYSGAAFTHIVEAPLHLKQVVNTNKCLIQLEKNEDTLVVHSAIDNLLKGASGQAVQNMNIIFGLPQFTGLRLKGSAF